MSELLKAVEQINGRLDTFEKGLKDLKEKAKGQADPKRIFNINRGESSLTSRGYSFLKAIGLATGKIDPELCKVEADVHNRVNESLKASGYTKSETNSFVMPFASAFLADEALGRELGDLMTAGPAADPEELQYLRKSFQKTMSWNTDTTGGTLVPLAAQGEPIELLRNKMALIEAGSQVIPMPPQGSVTMPKQTSASTAYWVGENVSITDSTPGTGALVLKAKKLAGRVKVPNELFRYSTPAADAWVRDDIAKVLQLKMDYEGLVGAGSAVSPKGIKNYSINSFTASLQSIGATGNGLNPSDFYGMLGKVHSVNGVVNEESFSFIVKPQLAFAAMSKRADAVSAGDRAGSFIELGFNPRAPLQYSAAGKKLVLSNQIPATSVKSTSSDLTFVLGGDFSQWIIAMAAALEIEANRYGETAWTNDLTEVRAILQVDMGPRHEESFVIADFIEQDGIATS